LKVAADDKSRPFGVSNPPLTGSLTGVQGSDIITATYSTAANVGSPIGAYDILPSLVDAQNRLPNYELNIIKGKLTIYDNTPPTIWHAVVPFPNTAGWNKDSVTVSWTVGDPESGISSSAGCQASVQVAETPGSLLVCQATNGAGLSSSDSVTFRIDKTAPVASDLEFDRTPLPINASVTVKGLLKDALSGVAAGEYSVDAGQTWKPVSGSFNQSSIIVTATTPVFTAAGVYNVCVRGIDTAGNVSAPDCGLLPVYDPNGGFVTGGGWITSAPGAYVADPSMTGRANFAFVSKYQKGASVPSGQTQFQFKLAAFTFSSTAYEWLVISGPNAQYKGSGTINGSGDFRFLLTATDGAASGGRGVDRFRIKIWNKVSGTVIYDNVPGSGDEPSAADPQAIGGGDIVIQTN